MNKSKKKAPAKKAAMKKPAKAAVYKKAKKAKMAAAVGPIGSMSSQDLAALIAMLLWMDDSSAPAYAPFKTFADQVTAIQNATGGSFPNTKLMRNIPAIASDQILSGLLNNAQMAIGTLMQQLGGLWDGCMSVGTNLVAQVANLP